MMFQDRVDAGRQLAARLAHYRDHAPVVLALPRGGVPVAYEVARALGAPLDVVIARKLGAPQHPELGIGAIGPGGVEVLDERLVQALGVSPAELDEVRARERAELDRRALRYRGDRPGPDVRGRLVVLVDDGIATGVTTRAALRAVRRWGPARVVLAAPVCARDAADALSHEADELVCVATPRDFRAVGLWYRDFSQTTDEEVTAILDRARGGAEGAGARVAARGDDGDEARAARRSLS